MASRKLKVVFFVLTIMYLLTTTTNASGNDKNKSDIPGTTKDDGNSKTKSGKLAEAQRNTNEKKTEYLPAHCNTTEKKTEYNPEDKNIGNQKTEDDSDIAKADPGLAKMIKADPDHPKRGETSKSEE